MSARIKHYSLGNDEFCQGAMLEDDDGPWMRVADHQMVVSDMKAVIERLRAEIKELRGDTPE